MAKKIAAAPVICMVCNRNPKSVNCFGGECSHCECPHRKRGPRVSNTYTPPVELRDERDALFDKQEV